MGLGNSCMNGKLVSGSQATESKTDNRQLSRKYKVYRSFLFKMKDVSITKFLSYSIY